MSECAKCDRDIVGEIDDTGEVILCARCYSRSERETYRLRMMLRQLLEMIEEHKLAVSGIVEEARTVLDGH